MLSNLYIIVSEYDKRITAVLNKFFFKLLGLNQCKLLDGGTVFFKGSTCLVEACMNRDMGMIDLLLKYGARDDDCKVIHYI